MPFSARRGAVVVCWQVVRPGCGRCAHAGAGGRTLDGLDAPAEASLPTPGRGRSYLRVELPELMPSSARQGGVEVTRQAVCPVLSWCAPAGAGGRTLDRQPSPGMAGPRTPEQGTELPDVEDPPADATQRWPGRSGSRRGGCTPRLWLLRAGRNGRDDTRQARCPCCGQFANSGMGEELPDSGATPADATKLLAGRVETHQAVCTPQSLLVRAHQGGRENNRQARWPSGGPFDHSWP